MDDKKQRAIVFTFWLWSITLAVCILVFLVSKYEIIENEPPDFPPDPFLDAATYQNVLNRVAAEEWSLVAFHREAANPGRPGHAGIVLALSKHRTRDEFLFLYHFPGGRNDAAYSVEGAKGDPQPVGLDIFKPMKAEWKTRNWTLLDPEGYTQTHSEKIGYRHPIHRTLEDIRVHGRFGNYDVLILFDRENEAWEFDVAEL